MILGHFLKEKRKKKKERKKNLTDTINKDRIIRDIRTFFEQEKNEEDYSILSQLRVLS